VIPYFFRDFIIPFICGPLADPKNLKSSWGGLPARYVGAPGAPYPCTGWKPVLLNLSFWFFDQDFILMLLI
jgi:hypothetical protein